MKVRPVFARVKWLPKSIRAITLWPFIIHRGEMNDALRAHEMAHWREIKNNWVVPWYLAYLILVPFSFRRPWSHPMEKMAYRIGRDIQEGR